MGYYPIFPTEAGAPLFPAPMHVYQWHSEGCELPREATVLAEGGDFPVQAFRWGAQAYGIQFHPEVTLEMMQRWTTKGAHRLATPGARPAAEHLDGHARHDTPLGDWLRRFLDSWVGRAGEARTESRAAHGNHAAPCAA
jgi:GMP synthase (glutamine-hydrolysing)